MFFVKSNTYRKALRNCGGLFCIPGIIVMKEQGIIGLARRRPLPRLLQGLLVKALFDKVRDFNDDVFRNIVSLRESQDLFDDLTVDEGATRYAIAAEAQVKSNIPVGVLE